MISCSVFVINLVPASELPSNLLFTASGLITSFGSTVAESPGGATVIPPPPGLKMPDMLLELSPSGVPIGTSAGF